MIKNKLGALKNYNKERINDDDNDDNNNDDNDNDDFRYLSSKPRYVPSLPASFFPDSPTISNIDDKDEENFNDYLTLKNKLQKK